MLNAYLMKEGGINAPNFMNLQNLISLNEGYAASLKNFMKRNWISYPIVLLCIGLIVLFLISFLKENSTI